MYINLYLYSPHQGWPAGLLQLHRHLQTPLHIRSYDYSSGIKQEEMASIDRRRRQWLCTMGMHGFHHGYWVQNGYEVHHGYGVHHRYGVQNGYGVHHGYEVYNGSIVSDG